MAKYPITVNLKRTPYKPAAPKAAAAKPVAAKPVPKMNVAATLKRAERVQGMEARESRLARSMPPKNKPATPTMSAAQRAAIKATLGRAERIQAEEARGDEMLMRRKPAAKDTISVVTRMRETPAKKKK
jgi:hypothetical protein